MNLYKKGIVILNCMKKIFYVQVNCVIVVIFYTLYFHVGEPEIVAN